MDLTSLVVMVKKKFIPFLLLLSASLGAEEVYLRSGQSVSELLAERGMRPIYGKGNNLEMVLRLNQLTLKKATRLPVNFVVIIPDREKPVAEKNPVEIHSVEKSKIEPEIEEKTEQEKLVPSELDSIFSLGTNYFKYKDQNNKTALLDTLVYLKGGGIIRTKLSKWFSVSGLLQLHYINFNKTHNTELSKRQFLTYGYEIGPVYSFNALSIGLYFGQGPWFSPISQNNGAVTFNQAPVNFIKPVISLKRQSIEADIYLKHFLSRETSDFRIRGGQTYGADLWFPTQLNNKKLTWGIGVFFGNRETNLNDETLSGIHLLLRI